MSENVVPVVLVPAVTVTSAEENELDSSLTQTATARVAVVDEGTDMMAALLGRLNIGGAERDAILDAMAKAEAKIRAVHSGAYFSTIDDLWSFEEKNSSHQPKSFVRRHHVHDTENRYEKTVAAAKLDETVEDSKQTVASVNSTRTKSSSDNVDIFGQRSNADSTHLLPHAPTSAPYWYPFVPFVLCTTEIEHHSWDFLQTCIHGSPKMNRTADGSLLPGPRMDHVGIKHFPTNTIRLVAQRDYFDNAPCVIIVPILNVKQVRKWNGEAYDAIVLAGNWRRTDGTLVEAALVYKNICASGEIVESDNFENCLASCLASMEQCDIARRLLQQMIHCVHHAFQNCTHLHNEMRGLPLTESDMANKKLQALLL